MTSPIRAYALSVVEATTLAGKLAAPPAGIAVDDDGEPLRIATPGRPPELAIFSGRKVSTPPLEGMRDPAQRARILHALANHELQAIELFAWALLAFPATPRPFRTGLLTILVEEQRHCAAYLTRLAALGASFGDHAVTGHFWNKLDDYGTPVEFVCAMGLTFENANLDFAPAYAAAARAAGDVATAAVLDEVHADEIGHVRFAYRWLRKLAPGDAWQAYLANIRFPLGPHRARGRTIDLEARRRAGLDEAFIAGLAAAEARRPGGAPR